MTMTDHNGYETAYPEVLDTRPLPVSFGPRDDDEMPHSWAVRGLTWLYEERRNVFADMMLAIVSAERGGRKTRS
jgi:hypothetical protein